MMEGGNPTIRLMRRPRGHPVEGEDLVFSMEPIPKPSELDDGQVLIKNLYLSLDPAIRPWMDDVKSYIPPIELGDVVRGASIGEIVASKHPSWKPGQIANCFLSVGWTGYRIVDGKQLHPMPDIPGVPVRAYLGILGGTGLTAYFGLLKIGMPKQGDTVVVSAAAGATGSVVCQIAKHVSGCHVVGIAGSEKKCKWLVDELGIDSAVNYKQGSPEDFDRNIRKACPQGVDIFFDNVGGWILDHMLKRINFKARVVLCGAISGYNNKSLSPGPGNYLQLITKSARMEGFILMNYLSEYNKAYEELGRWLNEGKLNYNEEVIPGIRHAPKALLKLFGFYGGNQGKLIVDIWAEDRSFAFQDHAENPNSNTSNSKL